MSAELLGAALAYDRIAADYDEAIRGDEWMRAILLEHYLRVFRPGARVLDVGCGTGIDALELARLGIRVVGVDASAAMIQVAQSKIAQHNLKDWVDVRELAISEVASLPAESFNGIVSSFAPLSTLVDLRPFSVDAARLLRPSGRMVLHLLNRFSLWEWLGYVARRRWFTAGALVRQRERSFSIGGSPVQHTLYFPRQAYRMFFADMFVLRRAYSLGSLRPPHTVRRLPRRVVEGLGRLERRLGGYQPLVNAGRFYVLDLEKRAT